MKITIVSKNQKLTKKQSEKSRCILSSVVANKQLHMYLLLMGRLLNVSNDINNFAIFVFCLFRENDITSVLDHTFCVEHNAFGKFLQHELKPNGKNIPVTEENKKEYVRYEEVHMWADQTQQIHDHALRESHPAEGSSHMASWAWQRF